MGWFNKKIKNKELVNNLEKNTKAWAIFRKDIEKKIRNSALISADITNFQDFLLKFKSFMEKNIDELMNNKIDCKPMINHVNKEIKWCDSELKIEKEIKELEFVTKEVVKNG